MMYFSTFISGFQEVIQDELGGYLSNVKIKLVLDGLIIYDTSSRMSDVRQLKFFNNSFALLSSKENTRSNLPESFIKIILRQFNFRVLDAMVSRKKLRFRVIVSQENELVKVKDALLRSVEEKIAKNKNFILNRARPDLEFWFLVRKEKLGLFGLRITKHKDYKKILDKGELRPELAQILVLLSEPNKEDVFLDPFAGSAAIPVARRSFPYKRITAYDVKPRRNRNSFVVEKGDATKLRNIKAESVDKIVTDPPWGQFDKNIVLEDLYNGFLAESVRVLKPGGVLVVLVSNKELLENILGGFSKHLKIKAKYNILVSGKKAGVYKILKFV